MKRNNNNLIAPILYSFRRCPFAIRARSAIYFSNLKIEMREVRLSNKPLEMLKESPKATVPILKLQDTVLDESIDIMLWALNTNDPIDLLNPYLKNKYFFDNITAEFDNDFKFHLDRYKYHNRYMKDESFIGKDHHKNQALMYLIKLETLLFKKKSLYLYENKISIIDLVLFPLVRQFKIADPLFFNDNNDINLVRLWLDNLINSVFFNNIMYKYKVWEPENKPIYFMNICENKNNYLT